MKKIFYLFVLLLCAKSIYAQEGFVYDNKTLKSEILNEERKYAIYLPPNYNSSERSYPVLYLLHPAGPKGTLPNQQGWINYGNLKYFMDNAIAKGEISPMIVVTPDANFGTKHVSYFNDPKNNFNFEDFFFKEFIPYIEKTYRCRTDRGSRAIAGASMGGGAAFFYTLHQPDLFSISCPLSAAIRGYEKDYIAQRYPNINESELMEWYKQYNVYELFKQFPDEKKSAIAWYIACGDDDALSINNVLLHADLKGMNIPHEFRIQNGLHDWKYWRSILPEVLRFISSNFSK
ncbi:MAG: alpha/beta hydrolase-fold protein [Phocaeicola sp.]|nr:alpha/beta hydrolase-fold protein [Phocaeicola sp.]